MSKCKSCTKFEWPKCHSGPCAQFWSDYNILGLAFPVNEKCPDKKNTGEFSNKYKNEFRVKYEYKTF